MSSMVLEMPIVATGPRHEIVQKKLDTLHNQHFAELKQKYRIADEGRVLAFLRQHSHLLSVLEEGRAVVNALFGEATPVTLRMQRDPDVGIEYLIAWVLTDLPTGEAVDRLFELGDIWYNTRLEIIDDLLHFNVGRQS